MTASSEEQPREVEGQDTRLLVLVAALLLAGCTTLLAFAVPTEARPVTIALGVIASIVLLAHMFTSTLSEVAPMVAVTGIGLAAAAAGSNVLLVAGAAVLLLAFTEVAALRTTMERILRRTAVDLEGRARDIGALVLVATVAAGTAAIGSLLRMSGQIIGVMLAGLAVVVIGKMIATSARN